MKALTKQTFRIYWQHSKKYPLAIFLLTSSLIGVVLVDSYFPFIYKQLFDAMATDNIQVSQVYSVVWKLLGVGTLTWIGWRVATFTINFFEPRVMADLTHTCYKYIQSHSFNFFNNNFSGSLVRKVNRFERAFEDITDQIFWHIGQAALKVTVVIIILFTRHWIMALIVFIWVVIYMTFNIMFAKYKLKFDIKKADADTKVTGHLADTITNNINLKIFSSEKKEFATFKKLTENLYKLRKFTWDLAATNEAVQGAFMVLLEFGAIYAAVSLWDRGIFTIGDIAFVQVFVIQIFGRLWDLGRYIRQVYERMADAAEMTEILMLPHEVKDKPNASQIKVTQGNINFSNVLFGYHQESKVFKNFNLEIKPGQRAALIGPSGGGKTTIVKLLFRFFDIQSGSITIDGQDISQVTQDSLRNAIALVPQEPILFHRSLLENISYSKPTATKEEVIVAAKLAHCHEFIKGFPEGYDTLVGERGVKLSGGERQRVAIARAILKNSPILVLDEATSSLDSESESLIQDALKNLMKDKTTIVIAHRLSTIMQMDRIIVLENGKILEEGKHEELLKVNQGTYQKLWEIQAGGFSA